MNNALKELNEKNKRLDRMQTILVEAKAEKRDLTLGEQSEFDKIEREVRLYNVAKLEAVKGSRGVKSISDGVENRTILRKKDSFRSWMIGKGLANAEEYQGLNLGSYLRSMVTGPRNEVERRALSAGTDSAGGFTVPSIVSSEFIDKLRPTSNVLASGALIVPLLSDDTTIARLDEDLTFQWKAENAAINESSPTFGRVRFQPKTCVALIKGSRELFEDSVNIESAITAAFTNGMAAELDRVALEGSGSGSEPTGLLNMTGVNELELGGELGTYLPILEAYESVYNSNSEADGNILLAPRDWRNLMQAMDSTGQHIQPPNVLKDARFKPTKNISVVRGVDSNESTAYIGRWSDMLIGIRTVTRIEVLKETFAGNLQYGMLAYMRVDIATRQPSLFCRLTGILDSGS